MTKAAEHRAERVQAKLTIGYPEAEGYDVLVYAEDQSIVISVERDQNMVWFYAGDRWPQWQILQVAHAELIALDRDDDGNPRRDENGQPFSVSRYQ